MFREISAMEGIKGGKGQTQLGVGNTNLKQTRVRGSGFRV
jgi:hypothetical protein